MYAINPGTPDHSEFEMSDPKCARNGFEETWNMNFYPKINLSPINSKHEHFGTKMAVLALMSILSTPEHFIDHDLKFTIYYVCG